MAQTPEEVLKNARPNGFRVCDTLMLTTASGREGPSASSFAPTEELLHPGVRCNECRRSFADETLARGVRYACIECYARPEREDYDLCPACMRLNKDGSHYDGTHDFIVVRDSRKRDLVQECKALEQLD